jgi:ssDNA-binding Zn-finger/Zn-ribbon topoisomerase 1
MKQLNLIYALQNNELVHVSEVERGLKCNCVCPSCGSSLVARKGEIMAHHFAHHNTEECSYGYETSLHMAAKDIILKAKKIWLPAVYINFDYKSKELIKEAIQINVDDVYLEKRMDDIIPDVIVKSGGKELIVEIFVTHAIDEIKLNKLISKDISTLEIDLSKKEKAISSSDLEEILLTDSKEKQWKYNSVEALWKKRFVSISDKRGIVSRGFALHIDNCPIKSRVWRGKPYANFIDDCMSCEFFISNGDKNYNDDNDRGYILCSGKQRISSIDDFKKPQLERIKEYDDQIDNQKTSQMIEGTCPNCGGDLVQRKSKYGKFWGCNNYPHCRFTLTIDSETGELITKA